MRETSSLVASYSLLISSSALWWRSPRQHDMWPQWSAKLKRFSTKNEKLTRIINNDGKMYKRWKKKQRSMWSSDPACRWINPAVRKWRWCWIESREEKCNDWRCDVFCRLWLGDAAVLLSEHLCALLLERRAAGDVMRSPIYGCQM